MSTQRIKTPCVGLCSTVYGDVVCRGCKRFHHEVVNWNAYAEQEKLAVWRRLEILLAQVMMAKLEIFDAVLLRQQFGEAVRKHGYDLDEWPCIAEAERRQAEG